MEKLNKFPPAAADDYPDLNDDEEEQKRIFLDITNKIERVDFNVSKWQTNITENKLLKPFELDTSNAFVKPSRPLTPPPGQHEEYPFWHLQQSVRHQKVKPWVWEEVRKEREEYLKQREEEEKARARRMRFLPHAQYNCTCRSCEEKRRRGGGNDSGVKK